MVEINIERGKPYVEDALYDLENEIKKREDEILIIIHGYGSSGRGGKIGKATRELLGNYENDGKIEMYIPGEDFDMFNARARMIKELDKETIKYYGKSNYGITIVKI